MTATLRTFAGEQLVFTSKRFDTLPPIPPRKYLTTDSDLAKMRELQWSCDCYPHLPFVPKTPSFDGQLLQTLRPPFRIVRTGSMFRLDDSTQSAWSSLEDSMIQASRILLADAILPLDFAACRLPKAFGYQRSHKTKSFALHSAKNSRDTFIQLAALCTMGIARNSSPSDLGALDPRWVKKLRDHGFHPVWIDRCRKSQVSDFSAERVGVIIDKNCGWLNLVPMMDAWNIPLLVCWEDGDVKAFDLVVQRHHLLAGEDAYVPSAEQIQVARDLQVSLNPPALEDHAMTVAEFPPPEKYSGQRYGERWDQFFERRRKADEQYILHEETAANRVSRLQRAAAASSHNLPGKQGAVVFEWVNEDDFQDGFYIRRRVNRSDVEALWDIFNKSQRLYDPIRDQWDLCRLLDPEAESALAHCWDDDSEDGYDDAGYEDIAARHRREEFDQGNASRFLGQPPDSHAQVHAGSTSALVTSRVRSRSSPVICWDNQSNLTDFLFFRYGLDPDHELAIAGRPADSDSVSRALRTLSIVDSESHYPKYHHPTALTSFVNAVSARDQPPVGVWDLDDSLEWSLSNKAAKDIVVEPFSWRNLFYLISPRSESPSDLTGWHIAVTNPTSVLECLRRGWGSSRTFLARQLISRGIPFRTVVPLPRSFTAQPRAEMRHYPRPAGYVPDVIDYEEYEESLKHFLLHAPHARAVFLKGGLLWRLALEVLGNEAMERLVLAGPSSNMMGGSSLRPTSQGDDLWDDDLSVSELDFVCGVIPTLTGHGVQTQEHSWWPRPPVFDKSPLNVGYWSSNCEAWFQTRLQKIRAGQEGLRSPAKWYKAMTLWKPTSTFIRSYEDFAVDYLHRHRVVFGP